MHLSHSKGLKFSWTKLTCLLSPDLLARVLSQMSHLIAGWVLMFVVADAVLLVMTELFILFKTKSKF